MEFAKYGIYLAGVALASIGIAVITRDNRKGSWTDRAGWCGVAALGVSFMALAAVL